MHEYLDKLKIIDLMREEFDFTQRTLALLTEEQMLTPAVLYDKWSVKDAVAHMAAWQNRLLGWVEASERGETPAVPAENYISEERLNEEMWEGDKDRPLHDVLVDFQRSYHRISDLVVATSEKDLFAPDLYEWTSDSHPLWRSVAANTYNHYFEHVSHIREWLISLEAD